MKRLYEKFLHLGIRTKLFIAFFTIIVTVVSVIGFTNTALSYNINRDLIVRYSNTANAQMLMDLESKTEDIENTLFLQTQNTGLLSTMNSLKHSDDVQFYLKQRVTAEMEALLHSCPYYKYVTLIDFNDRVYEMTKDPVGTPNPKLDVQHEKDTLLPLLGSCVWTQEDENIVQVKRTLISTETVEYLGIVVVGIPNSYFESFYSDIRDNTIDSTLIFNEQNEPIFLIDKLEAGLIEKALAAYTSGNKMTEKLSSMNVEYHGDQYIVTGLTNSKRNWKILNVIDTRFITRDLSVILRNILVTSVILIALSVVVVLFITRSFTQNINLLMANIEIIASGDFTKKIVPTSQDEIGRLASRFDFMRERIIELNEQISREREDRKMQELLLLEARYSALRSQYNPHFLYNALDSISSLAIINHQTEISEMIIMLTDLLRESISRKRPIVPLSDEISYVSKFTSLYTMVYHGNVGFTYDIPAEFMTKGVPSFLLQPIIENSVLHGIEKKYGVGQVVIRAYEDKGDLILSVTDNGIGFREHPEKLLQKPMDEKHTRVGLSSVQERIKLQYGAEYGVTIYSRLGEGTRVDIRLPMLEFNQEAPE